MRFLHSADIHLAPRLGYIEDATRRARRREDFCRQVDRLRELVREHGAEAVVLAGDVFDRDLPGQPEAARLASALAACTVPVLITPGTHDAWRPGGVWDRPWPSNVTVFRSDRWETVVVGQTAFHGLASLGRAREGGLFAGLPEPPAGTRFEVGIAHASMLWADITGKVDPKNLPFEESELDSCGFHYLALGDHHRTKVVVRGMTTAAYPGSPEGLAFDPAEAGPRHVLLVELVEPSAPAKVTRVPVNAREVVLEEIALDDLQHESAGDLAEAVRRRLAAAAGPDRLARFDLTGVIHHPLAGDPAALGEALADQFFVLQLRDRTRTLPETPPNSNTIRGAFERRLRARLETAVDGRERVLAERAMALGLQSLEGLLP
ncbi:MAG TPA: DNA repair exonuclease [Candidatus Dormibacteraeota bacterium]|nr:DNA repair exonuclease [Candidatus Dormibacteraeota bacterium]